jgi:hypothetical protein
VDEETVVVGHSTGALLIMRLLEQTSVYRLMTRAHLRQDYLRRDSRTSAPVLTTGTVPSWSPPRTPTWVRIAPSPRPDCTRTLSVMSFGPSL